MKRIIEKATCKKAIIFTVFFAILYITIIFTPVGVAGLLQITGGANILDNEFGYSEIQAVGMLTALGEQGRLIYLNKILPIDFAFSLSYMLCYVSWISLLIKHTKHNKWEEYLMLVPFLGMIFDWIEDLSIIVMLKNYPAVPSGSANIAGISGMLKLTGTMSSIVIIIILLFILIIKRIKADKLEIT